MISGIQRVLFFVNPLVLLSYQNSVEGGGRSSSLDVTQHGNTGILLQVINHHLLHQLGGDRLTFAVDRTLGHNDNIQTLTRTPLLSQKCKHYF